MRNKNLVFGVVFVMIVFVSLLVFQGVSAQTKAPDTGFEKICSVDAGLAVCVQQIYVLALGLGAIIALLMIVLAGYRYMTASGNAQQVEGAKEAFASAFIGLIVIFVAFILLYLINPDLVRFRALQFPKSTSTPGTKDLVEDIPQVAAARTGQELTYSKDLGLETIGSDGVITAITDSGAELILTPSLTSSLPYSFTKTLEAYGLDPSVLSIVEYDINDPSLLPDDIVSQLDGVRPSRILVVSGSLFIFNATAMAADTTGGLLLEAVWKVALLHYGVNLAPPSPNFNPPSGSGGGGSAAQCGSGCRACDGAANVSACSAATGCASHTDQSGNKICLPDGSGGSGGSGTPQECQSPLVWNSGSGGCECPNGLIPEVVSEYNGSVNVQTGWRCVAVRQQAFTPCNLNVSCEYPDPPGPEPAPPPGPVPPGGTCESGGGEYVVECYYPSQSQASIDCDRRFRGERQDCVDTVNNLPPGGAPGTVDGSSLPSCDSAPPGSACTTYDGAVHCRYSDEIEAVYCGALWANMREGLCQYAGDTNCYPLPDCGNPQTPGQQVMCE